MKFQEDYLKEYLHLLPTEQRQKTGAMAGTIREFETLREFFNSSTLVILIDLPFVFFFIYVISLIAGPVGLCLSNSCSTCNNSWLGHSAISRKNNKGVS